MRKHARSATLVTAGIAVVAVVGALGVATVASAITPGEPFTVSPAEGGPFTVVDVSGANCTEGPEPSIEGTVVGAPDVGVVAQFSATADENGDWATTFTVAPNKPAGAYEVTAICKIDPEQLDGDAYGNQPFTILEGEPATMAVLPLSGPAGQALTATVSGTLCRGQGAEVDLGVFVRVPEDIGDADEFVTRGTATPDAEGDWTTELTIPATTEPGTYGVAAECNVGGFQFFLYETVDVVLTAPAPPTPPPAAPVTRPPTLTG